MGVGRGVGEGVELVEVEGGAVLGGIGREDRSELC